MTVLPFHLIELTANAIAAQHNRRPTLSDWETAEAILQAIDTKYDINEREHDQ